MGSELWVQAFGAVYLGVPSLWAPSEERPLQATGSICPQPRSLSKRLLIPDPVSCSKDRTSILSTGVSVLINISGRLSKPAGTKSLRRSPMPQRSLRPVTVAGIITNSILRIPSYILTIIIHPKPIRIINSGTYTTQTLSPISPKPQNPQTRKHPYLLSD